MRILVLGGDGYLGWATAMHLAAQGHAVCACDNYLRRRLNAQFDSEPLFPVPDLDSRAAVWRKSGGAPVAVRIGDVTDWQFVSDLFRSSRPDAIVHYAELPSAPFSMVDRD